LQVIERRLESCSRGVPMLINCRIADEHPQRAEILRLLAALPIPGHVAIRVSPNPDPTLGWRVTVSTSQGTSACSVPTADGPSGIALAVRRALHGWS